MPAAQNMTTVAYFFQAFRVECVERHRADGSRETGTEPMPPSSGVTPAAMA